MKTGGKTVLVKWCNRPMDDKFLIIPRIKNHEPFNRHENTMGGFVQ